LAVAALPTTGFVVSMSNVCVFTPGVVVFILGLWKKKFWIF